jgi:hypothetical protein
MIPCDSPGWWQYSRGLDLRSDRCEIEQGDIEGGVTTVTASTGVLDMGAVRSMREITKHPTVHLTDVMVYARYNIISRIGNATCTEYLEADQSMEKGPGFSARPPFGGTSPQSQQIFQSLDKHLVD